MSMIAGLFFFSTLAIVSIFQSENTLLGYFSGSRRYSEWVRLSVNA